jgi:hypothetical protein
MVTNQQLAEGLSVKGYAAKVECLGGNITGVAVATKSGYHFVLTEDLSDDYYDGGAWLIGIDDPDRAGYGMGEFATASRACDLATLVGWADDLMGGDR